MNYSIFNHILESDVYLPELPENKTASPTLFFHANPQQDQCENKIEWLHHWKLATGAISISVGKTGDHYWLRFPNLIDFKISPLRNKIEAYTTKDVPGNTLSHLLIDQVIPRLLSHQGQIIIHASCVKIDGKTIAFCGESGWGKSTLAAYFYTAGHQLITDDCLLLDRGPVLLGTPNYTGLRLFDDSIVSLFDKMETTGKVCHYGSKKRIVVEEASPGLQRQIASIYFLTAPGQLGADGSISTHRLSKSAALIEMIKHCFPLDITDSTTTKRQFVTISELISTCETQFLRLSYPRHLQYLPRVLQQIRQSEK